MQHSAYLSKISNTLTCIADAIEAADISGSFDAELQGGVLTIYLPNQQQYVINQHAPTQQLWLSSPYSGASHFCWDAAKGRWHDNKHQRELMSLLYQEFLTYYQLILAL
ncbi:MAG: iron donor protein CyaY [Burkholderiales bacterium]